MSVMTLEGVVENGTIRLVNPMTLPENARVYIVIPEIQSDKAARIYPPRLVHSEQAKYFEMEVTEINEWRRK